MSDKPAKTLAEIAAEIGPQTRRKASADALDRKRAKEEETQAMLPKVQQAYKSAVAKAVAVLCPHEINLVEYPAKPFAPNVFAQKLEITRPWSTAKFGTLNTDITSTGSVSVVFAVRVEKRHAKEALAYDIAQMDEDQWTEVITKFVDLYSRILRRSL